MILINGRPLTALVASIVDLTGYTLPQAVVRETAPSTNSAGTTPTAVVTSPDSPIDLTVEVVGVDLADRTRVRERVLQALSGLLELEIPAEFPGRVLRCVLRDERPRVERWGRLNWAHGGQDLVIPLKAIDGVWLDKEPTVVALSTTPAACPIGTVAVAPRLEVFGASTPVVDPTVACRAAGGTTSATLPLIGSLGATAALEVDASDAITYRRLAGVRTAQLDALGDPGQGLPLLDPADAVTDLGQLPTLSLSALSGTPTGRAIYYRAY